VRRIALGQTALTLESLKLAKSHFDVDSPDPLKPHIPTKLIVPHGTLLYASQLLHRVYGDLAIGIKVEWHSASMSWALVSPTLVVWAAFQWTPHHRQSTK
jgi:hypothetical protein